MKNILFFFFTLLSVNLFSQAHNFRCLENEVYSIGCTTCDNVRTGKMITGMAVTLDGKTTELYNPIIAKYTTTTVTLIDYKFTTVTIKLASTYFATITDLLNAVKVCSDIGFSAGIDTLTYSNDTLKISFTNDSIAAYKLKIGDEQYIDTSSYASDTLKLSLFNDKKAQTKIYIPSGGGGGSDDQKIDTFSLSNDSLKISLETDGENNKSVSLNQYRQKIDTLTYSLDTLRIGLSNDSSLYKKVYIPQITDTDLQKVDTFDIVGNVLRLSLQRDAEIYRGVSLSSYLDNTDNQTLSWVSGTGNLTISTGNTVNLDGRYLITEVDGSTSNEIQTLTATAGKGTLNLSLGGGSVTLNDSSSTNELQTIDSFNITTNQLRISLSQDAPTYTVNLNPYLDNTDNQTLSIRAGKGTIDLTNSTSITLADSSATNEAWTIDGDDADTELISNQTVKFEGAGIVTTDYVPASDKIIITATEIDGSTSNELQNLSYGTKSGSDVPINISSGATINLTQGTNIFLDRIASNYLTIEGRTTIDTFSYSSDTLKISLTNDLEAAKKVYIPSGGATTNNIVTNGNIITSTVNGVSDTTLAVRTVNGNLLGNTITNTINGVSDTVLVIGQHTLTSSANSMTNIENGLSASANIINTNVTGFSNSILTTTINGISDTALINITGGTSKGWNGLRYSNDTIFRGSNSSTLDNGSKLRFNTYNYMDTYFDSYINSTGGATLPTLHLKPNNDVWLGATDTTSAGTAYAANKPVFFFRYASDGALNFGLNTTSNINRLGAGAVNFGGTGEAKGDYSFNSGFTGIANSTYAINLGANGQAKTGTYAFNSAGYGISSGFSSISMGYNSTVSNDYAFNSGRSSSVTGYEAANFGAVGTVSGQGAKNFGLSGQVSGTQSLGFKENNTTTADQAFNGSYYTYARAFGVSRFGYLGIDFTSQNANNWVSTDILFSIDNGKNDTTRSCALTMNARGWTQHKDLGTTQIKIVDSLAKPKAILEVISTTSGIIGAGGTKSQRDAIWNEGTQTGNFTPTYTKGWVNSAGNSVMDQCGLQFMTTNETLGSSLYVIRWNGTSYVWHQIY